MQISFTPEFAARLRQEMLQGTDEPTAQGHNPHGCGNTYDLEIALGQDLLVTSVGWANCYYQQAEPYTDEWGVGWRPCKYQTTFGEGYYTDIATHPLADDAKINDYCPPDPDRPELYDAAARLLETHHDEYYIVGSVVTTIFETAWALRGMSNLLVDFSLSPELAEKILDFPFH
jgi:uroporphyrinogen decarboxylase